MYMYYVHVLYNLSCFIWKHFHSQDSAIVNLASTVGRLRPLSLGQNDLEDRNLRRPKTPAPVTLTHPRLFCIY